MHLEPNLRRAELNDQGTWRSGASVALMSAAILEGLRWDQGETGLELCRALAGAIGSGRRLHCLPFTLWFPSNCPDTVEAHAFAELRRLFRGSRWRSPGCLSRDQAFLLSIGRPR